MKPALIVRRCGRVQLRHLEDGVYPVTSGGYPVSYPVAVTGHCVPDICQTVAGCPLLSASGGDIRQTSPNGCPLDSAGYPLYPLDIFYT